MQVSYQEQLQAALGHHPGVVPIDFGSTAVTGIHASCVAELREHFGLKQEPVRVEEPYQMLGALDNDLLGAMGVATTGVVPRNNMFGFENARYKEWRAPWGQLVLVPEDFNVTYENGDALIYPGGDTTVPPSGRMPKSGFFFDTIIRQAPFDEDDPDPEDNLEEFKPLTESDLAHFEARVNEAKGTGRAVVANFGGTAFGDIALVPAPFLKHPKGIRDIEEWYLSTAARTEFIHAVFTRQLEVALGNLERVHARVGDAVDVVFLCGTDFGTQQGPFCSLKSFKQLWAPYYKRMNDWIHEHTGWRTFKHSCGAVEQFMQAFIDAGFDIINPVQISARDMDPAHLKRCYGDRLVFWGGGVDTQRVLPFAEPSQVREAVLTSCRALSKDGGFVFNTVHNIQANTPVKNIVAMLDAVHEFNSAGA